MVWNDATCTSYADPDNSCLRAYERKTEPFRTGGSEEQTRLFLAVVRQTVFTKFYYEPLRSGAFGEAVLSNSGD